MVHLQNLETRPLRLPSIEKKKIVRPANVNYSVPVSRMKRLAREFGSINMPYREVGIKSFDYAYGELVEEE